MVDRINRITRERMYSGALSTTTARSSTCWFGAGVSAWPRCG
jgi:hypothetical protein